MKKQRNNTENKEIRMRPFYECRQILTKEQEDILADYLGKCSKMNYGLTTVACRRLAYEMAQKNNIKIPNKWSENKAAGLEWMRGFLKRHPTLSIRQPEGCSLSRATSFNKHNVGIFFDKLKHVLSRHENFSNGSRIWNLDETGTTTVQKPKKVIACKGVKQVSQVTSGERGSLVTSCCFISASGNTIPPAIIFPRAHFKPHMIRNAPPGSLGLATPSGWMNSELFVEVMRHFIRHTNSSVENPTLLLLDNHESHLSIDCIDLAKSNGVTILTFPPHCSNKLQPLDVGVYFSFKAHYNRAVDSWLMHHPGIPMTIYDIPECITSAFQHSMTPINILSGFRKSGIFPYNPDVFTEDDFLPSYVTDRPDPEPQPSTSSNTITELSVLDSSNNGEQQPEDVANSNINISKTPAGLCKKTGDCKAADIPTKAFLSPQEFRGFPKACQRKQVKNRKRGKSFIPTDTPEKLELEAKSAEKRKAKAKIVKRKVMEPETSSSSDEAESLNSSSEYDVDMDAPITGFEELDRNAAINDYVLVKFAGKKSIKYFVGKILSEISNDSEYDISYLRRRNKSNKFVYPNVPEVASVLAQDIVMILPVPTLFGKTKRQNQCVQFEVNFGQLDVQ